MKSVCFKIEDNIYEIIKTKAKKAGMTLKDYMIMCAKLANVEIEVKVTFDNKDKAI